MTLYLNRELSPSVKKKPPSFNARALIMREIMRSRHDMHNAILENGLPDRNRVQRRVVWMTFDDDLLQ